LEKPESKAGVVYMNIEVNINVEEADVKCGRKERVIALMNMG